MNNKTKRSISGVYFRSNVSGKWDNVCFEDLPESEQDKQMEGRDTDWLKSMAKIMANKLHEVCELFDISAEPDK